MQKLKKLNFRANARIKDIVGRGLINNDNVAITELIKNSRDAESSEVRITFLASEEDGLIIQDYGKGMSPDDIQNKWLNIAYSEKRQLNDKIYAGNKGVGRFSCDRLGKQLDLYTKTNDGELAWLHINWTDFEVDDLNRVVSDIHFNLFEISEDEFFQKTGMSPFKKGTVLHIKELRSSWTREKLLGLRKELERFVVDPTHRFTVFLDVEKFKQDLAISGQVENKIFDELNFRTTSIRSEIDSEGKKITTTLVHDGSYIFTLEEKNPYSHLKNIRCSVFFLNQPAKAYFKRQTGYHSVGFGSIFLFLNGFRVMPYGEPNNDWLQIDRRKQQGFRRYLGTRELVGWVEISDRDESFQAVSSREGLVNNEAFWELTSNEEKVASQLDDSPIYGYLHTILRKLERFVVEGLDWDRVKNIGDEEELELHESEEFQYLAKNQDILKSLSNIVYARSPEKFVTSLKLNSAYLQQLAEEEIDSYNLMVEDLGSKFSGLALSKLKPSEKRNLSSFVARQAKELAAAQATNTRLAQEKSEATRKYNVEYKKRLFAEASTTLDYNHVLNMHHQIGLLSGEIYKAFDYIIRKNNRTPTAVTKEHLLELIEKSLFTINKIKKASKFAARANFDLSSNRVRADLIQFIEEYTEEVSNGLDWGIKIKFNNLGRTKFIKTFKPIEISMLLDNLIDNSSKASAKKILISIEKKKDEIAILFTDDGEGISTSEYKASELFEKGITNTAGSGIGLYHVGQIVNELGGTVEIKNNETKGATVTIRLSN